MAASVALSMNAYDARPHSALTLPGSTTNASYPTLQSTTAGASRPVRSACQSSAPITCAAAVSPQASPTRVRIAASANTTGIDCSSTTGSMSARRQSSGPMPAGSPIVSAMTGRFDFMVTGYIVHRTSVYDEHGSARRSAPHRATSFQRQMWDSQGKRRRYAFGNNSLLSAQAETASTLNGLSRTANRNSCGRSSYSSIGPGPQLALPNGRWR